MSRNNKDLNNILERAAQEIRNETPDRSTVDKAADRVWARISDQLAGSISERASSAKEEPIVEQIRGCSDFQALIPEYLKGNLSDARALIFEDHTRECLVCRKALKEGRSGAPVAAPAPQPTAPKADHKIAGWKWAVAAAVIIGLGLFALVFTQRSSHTSGTVYATLLASNGSVLKVAEADNSAVTPGEEIHRGESIRTAKDGAAMVRLGDGSIIEMKERSELYVTDNSAGTTIHLHRGNLIVQAAKQRERHLYVATDDCLVSVTGTIFSVNNGTKGSRVSVIEGEVHVDHSGQETVLRPGDQVTTNPNLDNVPIKDEIAWSRDADRYILLLTELTTLKKELNEKVPHPGSRYSTELLDSVPEGTVLYAALPNLSATISESYRIMQERIDQNPALSEWLNKNQKGGHDFAMVMQKVRELGQYLGSEIVIAAELGEQGDPQGPLVLAELSNQSGIRSFLEQQAAELSNGTKKELSLRFIDNPLTAAGDANAKNEMFVWIKGKVLAASPKLELLQKYAKGGNLFVGSPLHSQIAEIYRDGAGLVVAADLQKIIFSLMRDGQSQRSKEQTDTFQKLGLLDLKHFIVDIKDSNNRSTNRAMLTFTGERRGIASWLAAPGPIGALDYVSPEANMAAAFAVKEPVTLVEDLFGFLASNANFKKGVETFEKEHNLDVRNDFAALLGGEFVFAIDGPLLPTPSWKLIFEVYDPTRLQHSFEELVQELNALAAKENRKGFKLERTDVEGRTFYMLKSIDTGLEAHFTFANGYMIAAPNRALINRAMKYRESGVSLLRSPRFLAALPEDGNANFSALFYHDLSSLLEPIAKEMAGSKALTSDQQQALKSLAASTAPTLACVYAQGDRIIISANGDNSPFGLSPGSLLGLPGSFAIQKMLENATRQQKPK